MKISIIGIGHVGSTLAYTLLQRSLGNELVLVGHNTQITEGHALDLEHAKAFTNHPVTIRHGNIEDTAASDIIVLTASVPWDNRYTSRFDIGHDNFAIFKKIVPSLAQISPEAKILVITNPVDVMTYHTLKLSGFPATQVFGIGTLIDSARFRTLLAANIGIHPDDLRAYILGEHGETQFPVFTLAMTGGTRIVANDVTNNIFQQTSRAGFEVIHRKGHTNFAIRMAAALVIEAIVWDTRRTMPLSILIENFLGINTLCLSLPVVVGKTGITQILKPDLSEVEIEAFQRCAKSVQEGITMNNNSLMYPGATGSQLKQIEDRFHTKPSSSYKNFLQITNGWIQIAMDTPSGRIAPTDKAN